MKQPHSQTSRIAQYLQQHPGEWIPMPVLSSVGANNPIGYCASISRRMTDVRKLLNQDIKNKIECTGGTRHSFYRLNTTPRRAE